MAGFQERPPRFASMCANRQPRVAEPSARTPGAAARATLALAAVLLATPSAVQAGSAARDSAPHSKEAHTRLARGKFLVANRSLEDPTFSEAVILLVDYDESGALGIVVNRPTDVPLIAALPEVKELRRRKDLVFLGGPVARDRMVLLLRTAATPPESILLFEKVYATGSLAALRRSIARGEAVRAYAGYTGWGPGQLDAEVARGDWLIGPADGKAIFDDPPSALWANFVERFAGNWASLEESLGRVY